MKELEFTAEELGGFGLLFTARENMAAIINDRLKKKLEACPVVYATEYNVVNVANQYEKMGTWYHIERAGSSEPGYKPPTHKARLVCIEPLKQDSAIDVLRDLVKLIEKGGLIDYRGSSQVGFSFKDVTDRARSVIEREERGG